MKSGYICGILVIELNIVQCYFAEHKVNETYAQNMIVRVYIMTNL